MKLCCVYWAPPGLRACALWCKHDACVAVFVCEHVFSSASQYVLPFFFTRRFSPHIGLSLSCSVDSLPHLWFCVCVRVSVCRLVDAYCLLWFAILSFYQQQHPSRAPVTCEERLRFKGAIRLMNIIVEVIRYALRCLIIDIARRIKISVFIYNQVLLYSNKFD